MVDISIFDCVYLFGCVPTAWLLCRNLRGVPSHDGHDFRWHWRFVRKKGKLLRHWPDFPLILFPFFSTHSPKPIMIRMKWCRVKRNDGIESIPRFCLYPVAFDPAKNQSPDLYVGNTMLNWVDCFHRQKAPKWIQITIQHPSVSTSHCYCLFPFFSREAVLFVHKARL